MSPAAPASRRILLTGCTGFVGKVVLEELLRRREELSIERVYVLIRGRRSKTAADRFAERVANSPCFSLLSTDWTEWCQTVSGDLVADGLGLSATDAARMTMDVTHIVNCAATVEFDLPIADATRINVTGALNMLAFAKRCTALRRFVHVSTAYVTPHSGRDEPITERLVDLTLNVETAYESICAGTADQDRLLATTTHANTYTFTKCMAEILMARRREAVPITFLRPSVVAACRRRPFPGWIDSRAAYAGFVALIGAGHLKVIRGDPKTLIDIVACDDVADRIISAAFDPAHQQEPVEVRHAVATLPNCGTVERHGRTHEEYFRAHPHEHRAWLAYVGTAPMTFRLNEWVHHHLPLGTYRMMKRVSGEYRAARKSDKLAGVLGYLNEAFPYFLRHTFDFRTVFPPLEDFRLESYLGDVSRGVSRHLLRRDPLHAPLKFTGGDLRWAFTQPNGNLTVRVLGFLVRKAFRRAGVHITYNEAEISAALEEVRDGDLVVLAPSHRSYIDFLIASLIPFAHPGLGLQIPRVAATDDFSRIPIVGRLLRRAGAFFIRRGLGRADPQLTQQIHELVRAGHSLEFYPEGTRSRGGRFLMPKRGILRALQGTGSPAVVLPLSISYERLAEEHGFLRELQGQRKDSGGLMALVKWTVRLLKGQVRLGRIHIRCGAPLRLEAATDVVALSRGIIGELQRHAVVSMFHLRAFCHAHASKNIDPRALRDAIVQRGGVVLDSKLDDTLELPPLIERTFEAQWMHLFYADALDRAPDNAAVVAHIRRNGFRYPHQPAGLGDALSDSVVTALFEPICRDYVRVANAIETIEPDVAFTPADVVQRIPGAFLPDVEDALLDLSERGVLSQDGGRYRLVDSSRVDLATYRSDCTWEGLRGAAA